MLIVLVVILGLLVLAFSWEYLGLRRSQARVPIRVHVNGTRGKSSVTRLIAAGMRAGGIRTCAKTTGSRPRMILEDGSEYSIQRQGRANIIEQVRALAVTARREAQALVAECMALNPRYQHLCEHTMLRSRVGVITNARADHLDVMGPTVRHLTLALCGTVPRKADLVTGETDPELTGIMRQVCEREGSRLHVATPESEGVTEEMLRGFSYVEHPDNVAVALCTCKQFGIDPRVALEGMWRCAPDIGVLRIIRLAFYAKDISFINALAANDPDSTLAIWQGRILKLFPGELRRVVMLNCRADRPHRSLQLGEMIHRMQGVDCSLFTGTGTRLALEAALKAGLDPERLIDMERADPARVFERAIAQIGKRGLVFGMGNIGAGGNEIIEYFENRAATPEQAA
ncbi:MAG TPA: poly-gamma-glutamate synthase PgsB [Myxococcota bacterium]|nr:poly-gamma-glutamate synthase PgsB [Myxococcota bacterium]HRY95941.1 poly-gamma-glutamate synthase PgsB [Myxococcota bacterium]